MKRKLSKVLVANVCQYAANLKYNNGLWLLRADMTVLLHRAIMNSSPDLIKELYLKNKEESYIGYFTILQNVEVKFENDPRKLTLFTSGISILLPASHVVKLKDSYQLVLSNKQTEIENLLSEKSKYVEDSKTNFDGFAFMEDAVWNIDDEYIKEAIDYFKK